MKFALWLVLTACPIPTDADLRQRIDGDGDGEPSTQFGGTDCDDADPTVSGPCADTDTSVDTEVDTDPDYYIDNDDDNYSEAEGDCDDHHANVHPNVTAFSTEPRASGSYDFNCDRFEEPEFTATTPSPCTKQAVSGENPSCIVGSAGWTSERVDCGVTAEWFDGSCDSSLPQPCMAECVVSDLDCQLACLTCTPRTVSRTQACR